MPVDDYYWNPLNLKVPNAGKKYVDPWDLENYVYLREHLDSADVSTSSDPSSSSGDFAEANSTSFYYVPGNPKRVPEIKNRAREPPQNIPMSYDYTTDDQSNYAAIDEIKGRHKPDTIYDTTPNRRRLHSVSENMYRRDPGYIYEERLAERKTSSHYDVYSEERGISINHSTRNLLRNRGKSVSHSDYGYAKYPSKQETSYKLEEFPDHIYDDIRRTKPKPSNFSLSNYGHLKIDYSYSWNNLYKIISN